MTRWQLTALALIVLFVAGLVGLQHENSATGREIARLAEQAKASSRTLSLLAEEVQAANIAMQAMAADTADATRIHKVAQLGLRLARNGEIEQSRQLALRSDSWPARREKPVLDAILTRPAGTSEERVLQGQALDQLWTGAVTHSRALMVEAKGRFAEIHARIIDLHRDVEEKTREVADLVAQLRDLSDTHVGARP